MTTARLKILCALLAILLIGAVVLIFHYRNAVQWLEARPAAGPGYAALVERAFRLETARGGMPLDQIRQQEYAIAVGFPDRSCVQIAPPPPSIGGHSLYCFRNTDGALVEQYQVGE